MTRAVYDAWHDAGLVEHYHRHAQDRLRATWPTLANALDAMPRAAGGQEKPELPVCGPFALYLHGECYSDGYETLDAVLVDALELATDRYRDHDEQGGIEVRSVPAAPVGGQAEPSDADAQSWAPEGEPTEAAARTLYRQHLRHWEHDWDETSEAQRTVYRGMAGDILRAAAAVSGEQP